MIGAGVFAAVGPAAAAGAVGLLVGLGIAGSVAFFNATLVRAARRRLPASGGTADLTQEAGPLAARREDNAY